MKWLILLSISSNLYAASLQIKRPCAAHLEPQQRAEQLYHIGEMTFEIKLSGLEPKEDVELRFELMPADGLGRRIIRDYTFRPNSHFWLPRSNIRRDGTLSYNMRSPFDKVLKKAQKNGEGNLWNARISYIQADAKISGTVQTSFIFAPKIKDFYQVLGNPVCQSLSIPVTRGEIINNATITNMTVTREQTSQHHFMNTIGFTLCPNNNTASSIFLSPLNSAQMWLFADWSFAHGGNVDGARSLSWTLAPGENGLFAERTTSWWTPTARWQTEDIGDEKGFSCTVVTNVSSGWMSLERVEDELYVVPKSMIDRPQLAQDFAARAFPASTTCGTRRPDQLIHRFQIEDGVTASFYQTFSSSGEIQ